MKSLVFAKMTGGGNDFIVIDNRRRTFEAYESPNIIRSLCQRGLSIGADGLILIEDSPSCDVRMRYFNADGKPASFCGNGARCIARFAHLTRIVRSESLSIECDDQRYQSRLVDSGVRLELPPPTELRLGQEILLEDREIVYHHIRVGVPHIIVTNEFMSDREFEQDAQTLRNDSRFAPLGVNVNLLRFQESALRIRTYERGVERETLACGSGCVATALIAAALHDAQPPIVCHTRGGAVFLVEFSQKEGQFTGVALTGEARLIYRGEMNPQALSHLLSTQNLQNDAPVQRSTPQDS